MSLVVKILTTLLGVLAIIACVATVVIVVYSTVHPNVGGQSQPVAALDQDPSSDPLGGVPTPTSEIDSLSDHVHSYVETIDLQATCTTPGRVKYTCECGDYYYRETPVVDHLAGDWEILTEPAASRDGMRVKTCIYCGLTMAEEVIPATGPTPDLNPHVHDYQESIESEPTCTIAGVKRFSCSCGSYYRENIPAIGHVVGDWEVIQEPTLSERGHRQRVCKVCGELIDSREIDKLPPTPEPSQKPLPSGATPTPTPSPTATPSAPPHTHTFTWRVSKTATCSEQGIRTGTCTCGAEDQEAVPKDANNHHYVPRYVPAAGTQPGRTDYVCEWCGDVKK